MRLRYIQRGTVRAFDTKDIQGVTGKDGLISLGYMGSSEFEFGSVPYSFRRMMNEYDQYNMHKIDMHNYASEPLYVYCKDAQLEEIVAELKSYIEKNKSNMISQYMLKESISFHELINKSPKNIWLYRGDNFWWDLSNDFMFFFANKRMLDKVTYALDKDYNDWWIGEHTDDERAKLIQEATTRRFI